MSNDERLKAIRADEENVHEEAIFRRKSGRTRMQRGRSPFSLSDLLAAELLHPGQELRFRENADLMAVLNSEGRIVFDGQEFPSPSTAAKTASGGTSTNGWLAWYANEGGRWTPLAKLRERLQAG
jgi:hypothetical protein